MNQNNSSITEGVIWKALLSFFFPILFGTFFQQLYNTIDAIIVGKYVGTTALAAVGGGSAVFVSLIVGFFIGLTSGAGVLISQFYGSKNKSNLSLSVHTSISLCIWGGLAMTIIAIAASPLILKITKTPDDTYELAKTYLMIFFTGMIPMFIYNMGSSILRAVGDSRTPLWILIIGTFSNIVLDLLLVIVFKMGVPGVAIATVICQVECAVITIAFIMKTNDIYKLTLKKITFTPHILSKMLRLGFPTGIQSCLYTVSNLIIQTFINSFGTTDVAAWAAFGKIDAVFWTVLNALGVSFTTFAGQNFGAGKIDRIKKGVWQTLGFGLFLTEAISISFLLSGKQILGLFTNDTAVISEGVRIMKFLIPFWWTYLSIEVLSGAVRGAGSTFIPMVITIFGVCLLRIVWIFSAVPFWNDILTVLASYPITWTVTSIAFWVYYLSGKWLKKTNEATKF